MRDAENIFWTSELIVLEVIVKKAQLRTVIADNKDDEQHRYYRFTQKSSDNQVILMAHTHTHTNLVNHIAPRKQFTKGQTS